MSDNNLKSYNELNSIEELEEFKNINNDYNTLVQY